MSPSSGGVVGSPPTPAAIARQRLLTAKYEYFKLKDESKGVEGGFRYKTVSHVTLKSIAIASLGINRLQPLCAAKWQK